MKNTLIISLLLTLISGSLQATEEPYEEDLFSEAELDQMLAPIALYPDVLLSQVLMASTYPLEVVEASRWSQANPDIVGEEAEAAMEDKDWDLSVKYLVAFPDLIQLMDENLSWTRNLGEAFLLQEEQIMERIQILRHKSKEEGSLASMSNIRVQEEEDVIILEPARLEVIHVPYYSSYIAYGDWWWYDYPPVYWNPPPVYHGRLGLCWSRGYRVSTGFYFSAFDWHLGNIVIRSHFRNQRRYDYHDWYHRRSNHDRYTWRHDSRHRRGVDYRKDGLKVTYGRGGDHGKSHKAVPSRDYTKRYDPESRKRSPYYRSDRPDNRPRDSKVVRSSRQQRPEQDRRDRVVKSSRNNNRPQPARSPDRVAGKKTDRNKDRSTRGRTERQKPPAYNPPPPKNNPVVSKPNDNSGSGSYSNPRPSRNNGRSVASNQRPSIQRTPSRAAPSRTRDP